MKNNVSTKSLILTLAALVPAQVVIGSALAHDDCHWDHGRRYCRPHNHPAPRPPQHDPDVADGFILGFIAAIFSTFTLEHDNHHKYENDTLLSEASEFKTTGDRGPVFSAFVKLVRDTNATEFEKMRAAWGDEGTDQLIAEVLTGGNQ